MKRKILFALSSVLILLSFYMVLVFVPTEIDMGIVQRIFYYHVPLAWIAFLAFFVVFTGSIIYLAKRSTKWDNVASASAEIGLVFISLMLITGSIWAKPAWGVWWIWEPRLTTSLVLWFIYVAYFIVRGYVSGEERKARFGAVVGIIGFLNVPLVFLSVTLWRTQHPPLTIFSGGLEPPMLATLLVCLVAFNFLYFYLLSERSMMKNDERMLSQIKETIARRNA
ncbi:MAG: cytochrome c biogenesis protein [Dehalococcoidales bacterium]|jgi:heme exporter protein C|nr:cytochrome c biogenesis protein [Dehalococcoidales bacterium]MDD3265074.1 cytochrome c biogenesis protein [Dehalococcoidales bacterium]MDD4322949.1 cytochrome c biogenesis protein [Dehalococcoidales bacterium]MDD4794599.1 cytochrome c biogenesis protein [Dehalococcoidales bacterium]MDD5122550.1 cytochrome c biogenesis protein [Dehalococcoidales bacterium]